MMLAAFEREFAKYIGAKYALMVNSGSSANLLALQCLINPYRKKRLKEGDEVLIPALCWSTSLWPIIQSGLKPKFVDIGTGVSNNLLDILSHLNMEVKDKRMGTIFERKDNVAHIGTLTKMGWIPKTNLR